MLKCCRSEPNHLELLLVTSESHLEPILVTTEMFKMYSYLTTSLYLGMSILRPMTGFPHFAVPLLAPSHAPDVAQCPDQGSLKENRIILSRSSWL